MKTSIALSVAMLLSANAAIAIERIVDIRDSVRALAAKLPNCAANQYVVTDRATQALVCKTFPNCSSSQSVQYRNGEFTCVALPASPPTAVAAGPSAPASSGSASYDPGPAAPANTSGGSDSCTAAAYLCDAYRDHLGRLPDQAGAQTWNSAYNHYTGLGMTAAEAQAQIRQDIAKDAAAFNSASASQQAAMGAAYNQNAAALGVQSGSLCSGGANCGTAAPSTFVPAPVVDYTPAPVQTAAPVVAPQPVTVPGFTMTPWGPVLIW